MRKTNCRPYEAAVSVPAALVCRQVAQLQVAMPMVHIHEQLLKEVRLRQKLDGLQCVWGLTAGSESVLAPCD